MATGKQFALLRKKIKKRRGVAEADRDGLSFIAGGIMRGTEEQIKRNVIDQLRWDSRVEISNLQVDVSGGEVKVAGTIPSWRMREIVNWDVLDVPGVIHLVNELKVKHSSSGIFPGDEEIKTNIEKMLSWDPDINAENRSIAVKEGKFSLKGTVNAIWQKLKAENIASNVKGVLQINNMLAVAPTGEYVDQTIAEDIMAAFSRNIHIDGQDISLKVENQIISLSGKVSNWKAYYAARDIALYTRGVIDIQNYRGGYDRKK
jgi:hyperosmotically inducible protein